MFEGKMKAITFSFDDGTLQDIRLTEMFNKYGIKGTFNLNSGLLGTYRTLEREGKRVNHNKVNASDVKSVYKGHEVAVHTKTHPNLTNLGYTEIVKEVEEDRIKLSEIVGYEVVGMAYPSGGVNNNDFVAEVIKKNTNVKYARTNTSCHNFNQQENLFRFNPSVFFYREWDMMLEMADRFINLKTEIPQVLYIWGHGFEFDINNTWDAFEEFCKHISGKSDIFYGTNREILLGK